MENGLLKGAKNHVDKAIRQLAKFKEPGIIYLLYSLDLNYYIEDLSTREKKFTKLIRKYFQSKKNDKISLEMMHENKIFDN